MKKNLDMLVDKDKNTCTVRMIADREFYENVGQGQESTVSINSLYM